MIVWYVLAVIFVLFLSTEYYAFKTGVPTLASFPTARRKMIEALAREFAARPCMIVDLGSGNGQLALKIARALPRAQVIGLELSPVPWLISLARQKLFGPQNAAFVRADFWCYDCSRVNAVTVFLTENVSARLSAKLRTELKPGAQVITNDTPLPGWQPAETLDAGLFKTKVCVYRQGN